VLVLTAEELDADTRELLPVSFEVVEVVVLVGVAVVDVRSVVVVLVLVPIAVVEISVVVVAAPRVTVE
jgi:hypothetical protein